MTGPGEVDAGWKACEEFELLAADLLIRFVDLPAPDVDAAIGVAQERVCEVLDLDHCGLWQWSAGPERFMTLTHDRRPAGGPPLPERTDAAELFPWTLRETLAGRTLALGTFDELPPEAPTDRVTFERFGVCSAVILPLSTGGGPVLGVAAFGVVGRQRTWAPEVVRRLRIVAQIFAGALGRRSAEEALRESGERLQLAAESAGAGFWRLDLEASSFWLTDEARRHLGLSDAGPVDLDRVLARIVPEDRPRVVERIREVRESRAEASVEYRVLAADGVERWLHSRGRFRPGASGESDSLMGVTLDATERRRAEAALGDLSRRLIRAQEEERALLARELHDDLSQRLAVLAIGAGRAELSATDGRAGGTLQPVREGLVRLSEDVHALAYQLHPSVLEELGLAEALRTECDRVRRQGRVGVLVHLDPTAAAAGTDAALCLFRVAQEALRNAERHSGAREVTVSLRARDGGLLLTVSDDGVGFEPEAPRGRRSLGLASMRERVAIVGGTLRVESAPGEGTAIHAWVPAKGTAT